MRAIVLEGAGDPSILVVRDGVAASEPQGEEIRVRVRAFGINRADVLQRRGRYPAPPDAIDPKIPGLEYAGEVESLGPRARERKVGDRVMGITGAGAYAELLCVHERTAVRIPDGLGFEEAGAIPEAFMTAYDALERGSFAAGGSVLIHAIGSGVGIAAAQLVAAAGGIAIGTSRTRDKLDRAREYGMAAGALLDEKWDELARRAQPAAAASTSCSSSSGPRPSHANVSALRTGGNDRPNRHPSRQQSRDRARPADAQTRRFDRHAAARPSARREDRARAQLRARDRSSICDRKAPADRRRRLRLRAVWRGAPPHGRRSQLRQDRPHPHSGANGVSRVRSSDVFAAAFAIALRDVSGLKPTHFSRCLPSGPITIMVGNTSTPNACATLMSGSNATCSMLLPLGKALRPPRRSHRR